LPIFDKKCHRRYIGIKDFVMQTMNISLPDPMKQYVDEQVTVGEYSSASEYMRKLVRADQKRNAREQLEQTLLASLSEGEAQEATPEFWSALRAEFDKRKKTRQGARQTVQAA
jgi:antitoxin ParD1/3/4